VKFATYERDSTASAQDYAQQRYYSNVTGRFLSPDPGGIATADPSNPTSWNRYAYVQGDPVNFNDPGGRFQCEVGVGDHRDKTDCEVTYLPIDRTIERPAQEKPDPSCLDGMDPKWVKYVEAHHVDANSLGVLSGVMGTYILGWAALESNWGTNGLSTVNKNDFSWAGSKNGNIACPGTASPNWACFSSFFVGGLTALLSTANHFQYGGQTGVAAATILQDAFANGATIPGAFDVLAKAHYTPDSGYGAGVATRISQVIGVETCLTSLDPTWSMSKID